MRAIKIYLIVVTCMLIVALGFGVYVWYKLQILGTADPYISNTKEQAKSLETNGLEGQHEEAAAPDSSLSNKTQEPIVIEGDTLSDSQKKALETFGFETDSVTITKEMIECAERELGKERVLEIMNGAAPGPLESLTLLGCI